MPSFFRIGLGVCLISAGMSLFAQDGQVVDRTTTADIRITPVMTTQFRPSHISEYSSGETIELIAPIQEPIITRAGRVILSSVSSYRDTGDGIGKCSLLARKNLDMLLRNLGNGSYKVFQGDAAKLIFEGLHNGTIQSFSDKKSLMKALNERKEKNIETVFDAYRRNTPSLEMTAEEERTGRFFNQGHRAVIFLGDDENWYILDTIDGNKSDKPQLLSDYLPKKFGEKEWFLRVPGYSGVDLVSTHEFNSILPFLSPELQLWWHGKREFVTQQPMVVPIAESVAFSANLPKNTLR